MTSVSPLTSSALSALGTTPATTQVGPQANNTQMNQFLKLLTTQLQNQDPMQPTDPTQFVAQLAQFSTVEQLVQGNTTLNTMNQTLSTLALGQYSGMINHTVNASVTSLTVPASGSMSSNMQFTVTAPTLKNVHVAVTNAQGAVVASLPLSGSSGSVTFDGTNGNGQKLVAGQYTVAVVGTDSTGATQQAGTLSMSGSVAGVVQGSAGSWQLQLQDGRTVDASSVTSLQ